MAQPLRPVAALAFGVVLVVAGCSSGGDDDDRAAPATSSSTSSSTTASSTTSTTAEPAGFPRDPADYTAALVRAWGVGDRTEAARFASPSAVDALFGFADPGGPRWELRGACEGAGGTTYGSYPDPKHRMVVLLGIPVANGNTVDGPQEVGTALFQPG